MANLVKTKQTIFFSSTVILAILWLSELSWFKTEVIKKWDQENPLVWSDFNGDIPWGTSFDAGIFSKIYAETDSSGGHEIYAGQNNLESWTKHRRGMEDLLRHEQYHFNITELHTRILRQMVADDTMDNLNFDSLKLIADANLNRMQDLYDEESQHSILSGYQHLWEYNIDSLLSSHEPHRGNYSNRFGGTRVWFPSPPEHEETREDTYLRDCYYSSDYWADLSYCIYHDVYYEGNSLPESWRSYLNQEEYDIQSMSLLKAPTYEKLTMTYEDTVNRWRYQHHVYYIAPYEYRMRAAVPMGDPDSLIYQRMSTAFLDNFSFEHQEFFWLDLGREQNLSVFEQNLTEVEETDSLSPNSLSRLPFSDFSVAYHQPIKDGEQLIIPFKIVRHPMVDVEEIRYLINDERFFSQMPDSPYQIVKIDMDLLKPGKNSIQFGYTALSDSSTAKGRHFYSSIVDFDTAPQ